MVMATAVMIKAYLLLVGFVSFLYSKANVILAV